MERHRREGPARPRRAAVEATTSHEPSDSPAQPRAGSPAAARPGRGGPGETPRPAPAPRRLGDIGALISAIATVFGVLLGFFGLPTLVNSPTAMPPARPTVTVTVTAPAPSTAPPLPPSTASSSPASDQKPTAADGPCQTARRPHRPPRPVPAHRARPRRDRRLHAPQSLPLPRQRDTPDQRRSLRAVHQHHRRARPTDRTLTVQHSELLTDRTGQLNRIHQWITHS